MLPNPHGHFSCILVFLFSTNLNGALIPPPLLFELGVLQASGHPSQAQKTQGDQKSPQRSTPPKSSSKNNTEDVLDTEAIEAQRRLFAISMITSLADEARSFRDVRLRSGVLARAADALWEADEVTARAFFRRAWQAAEEADADDSPPTLRAEDPQPAMVIALRMSGGGGDLRSQVLNLAARRDRTLADEFLKRLIEAQKREAEQSPSRTNSNAGWTTSDETAKRLNVAHRLLEENLPQTAYEFAAPVLNQVNQSTISFLSRLRLSQPELADRQFMLMIEAAESDPNVDANTVSGLSSYLFTPGFYVTFTAEGSVQWTPPLDPIIPPPLNRSILNAFFRVAGNILLRPSPPVDQDVTSAGRTGRYFVIKRLLPLFEQYAPELAATLKSQLVELAASVSRNVVDDNDFLLRQGLEPEGNFNTVLDRMEERVERANDERGRDEIYADVAAILAAQGDSRALDVVDKISQQHHREMARRYVNVCLLRAAVSKKDVAAATRFARADSLSHVERSWALTQIARLLMASDRTRALETLEEAFAEAQRIETDEPRRANMMLGIANEFLTADAIRPWEVAGDAVKAANAMEQFEGEDIGLMVPLITGGGLKLVELDMTLFSLSSLSRKLAKNDFTRASELAKGLKYEAPRALATLAVASVALERRVSTTPR